MSKYNRKINFGAGPAMLPLPVLEKIKEDFLNYKESGLSVVEMSHRSENFMNILLDTKEKLKKIMNIPDTYEILFLQGGATAQFSMIPVNLVRKDEKIGYVLTGVFAQKSFEAASKLCKAVSIADSSDKNYDYIPEIKNIPNDLKYIHITGNNTAIGTAYYNAPKVGVPVIADWSSAILGQEIKVEDYALLYAGAQKNMGIAGLTVVILRKDIILKDEDIESFVPNLMKYEKLIKSDSMINTPPTFAIYCLNVLCDWIISMGGVASLEKINREKSKMIYDIVDEYDIYENGISQNDRSIMNITFNLKKEGLTEKFLSSSSEAGLVGLKGYKLRGGIRASLYNGVSIEDTAALAEFMKKFAQNN